MHTGKGGHAGWHDRAGRGIREPRHRHLVMSYRPLLSQQSNPPPSICALLPEGSAN